MNFDDLTLIKMAIWHEELRRFDIMNYGDLTLSKMAVWHYELRRFDTMNYGDLIPWTMVIWHEKNYDLTLWTTAIWYYELRRFVFMNYGDLTLWTTAIWHWEKLWFDTKNYGDLTLSMANWLSVTVIWLLVIRCSQNYRHLTLYKCASQFRQKFKIQLLRHTHTLTSVSFSHLHTFITTPLYTYAVCRF